MSENAAQSALPAPSMICASSFPDAMLQSEGGLISVIATNAVQAAPAALVGTISAAATLAERPRKRAQLLPPLKPLP